MVSFDDFHANERQAIVGGWLYRELNLGWTSLISQFILLVVYFILLFVKTTPFTFSALLDKLNYLSIGVNITCILYSLSFDGIFSLIQNKIRIRPQKVFYGLTALQQLWVYRLNFFCEITRRFTYSLRTGDFTVPSRLSQVKKRKKKSEFLQFRGGLIPDSFILLQ